MVAQNHFSGGASDRFFGGAGEGFLAILGFKVFRTSSFRSGLRISGRAVRFLVGFVFRVSLLGFQVGSWVFRSLWSISSVLVSFVSLVELVSLVDLVSFINLVSLDNSFNLVRLVNLV